METIKFAALVSMSFLPVPHLHEDWKFMNKEQEMLLQRLSRALFSNPDTSPLPDDVLKEAKAQTISSLVMNDYQSIANTIRLFAAHAELSKILKSIPFTTFKGYASAFYYPTPEKRTMGDVDFIVAPEHRQEAIDRLLQAGWVRVEGVPHVGDEPFKYRNVTYELHSEIKGIPNSIAGISTDYLEAEEKIRASLTDLIDTAVTVDTQQGAIIIPDEFHHGLIMLLHVAVHMMNTGGVGLRHLCDWAVYVHRVNFEQYRKNLEEVGLWTFACQLTAVSSKYLGLPQKQWAGEWSEPFLESLIDDILTAGNFGMKNLGRGASLVLENASFAELTRKKIPISRKYPAFLPFAMVFYLCRYITRVFTGKTRLVKLSTITGAKERQKLYDQFRLFDIEKPEN